MLSFIAVYRGRTI